MTDSTTAATAPNDPPPGVATKREKSLRSRIASINELGILSALLAIILITALFNPDFLRFETLITITRQSSFIAIMAMGTVFLLSMREIDLSVGAVYGLTAVVGALLVRSGLDPRLAGAACVLAGVGLGLINGLVANGLKIATIIATLGTLSVYRGTTLIMADSRTVGDQPRDQAFYQILGGDFLNVPVPVWVMIAVGFILHFVYRRTKFGFVVRSIGSNPEAATMSGISVPRVRLMALAMQGGLCGVAGMLTLAFFSSADPGLGMGNELLVIASAIIGGTSLAGGTGTIIGAVLGATTIGMIRASLIQFGVTTSWSTFVTGCVVIGAVALDGLIRRRREKHLNQS